LSTNREYFTIANSSETTTNIKGSTFISRCERVISAIEAMSYIQSIKLKHMDATHNCWAYRISPNEYRFNDDGEPAGTAGQPILQAILGSNLEQVCVVITRYYGGTKLGVGGLVRAYGGGASAVLKMAQSVLIQPTVVIAIEVAFSEQNSLYHFMQNHPELTIVNNEYTAKGLVISIKLLAIEQANISEQLTNHLRGRLQIKETIEE
jgi:uncharacterized YigZ family protein